MVTFSSWKEENSNVSKFFCFPMCENAAEISCELYTKMVLKALNKLTIS